MWCKEISKCFKGKIFLVTQILSYFDKACRDTNEDKLASNHQLCQGRDEEFHIEKGDDNQCQYKYVCIFSVNYKPMAVISVNDCERIPNGGQ